MNIYTVSFFGHRELPNMFELEDKLMSILRELISKKEYVEFLVGRNGDFDQLYGEWKSKNITGRDFMRRMGLSANTFYRRVREYEAEHGIAEPTSA